MNEIESISLFEAVAFLIVSSLCLYQLVGVKRCSTQPSGFRTVKNKRHLYDSQEREGGSWVISAGTFKQSLLDAAQDDSVCGALERHRSPCDSGVALMTGGIAPASETFNKWGHADTSAIARKKMEVFPSLTGTDARTLFLSLLLVANIVRGASLLITLYWMEPRFTTLSEQFANMQFKRSKKFRGTEENANVLMDLALGRLEWDMYFLYAFPGLLFLSAYSVAALFLAQVYYGSILISVPFLRSLFAGFNCLIIVLFGALAASTRTYNAYGLFRDVSLMGIGVLNIVVGSLLLFFGIKVIQQVEKQDTAGCCEMTKETVYRRSIVRKVFLLSYVCSFLFFGRGMACLLFIFKVLKVYYPLRRPGFCWNAITYFVSEMLPDVLSLMAFWSPSSLNQENGSAKTMYNQEGLLLGSEGSVRMGDYALLVAPDEAAVLESDVAFYSKALEDLRNARELCDYRFSSPSPVAPYIFERTTPYRY